MLNFLVPAFIKNFDKKLLLRHPFWYIVKLHYVAYFTILMWILSFIIGSLVTIDITSYNPLSVGDIWIFVFVVLGIILFCVWMYHLTIYNNEDRFGKFNRWDDVKFLFVFMIGINLIMSFSYPMQIRLKQRLANTISDAELAHQYNTLNLSNKYITRNLQDFQYCGYNIHDKLSYYDIKNDSNAYHDQREIRDLSKYNNFLAYSPESNNYFYDDFDFTSLFFHSNSLNISEGFKQNTLPPDVIEKTINSYKEEHIIQAISKTYDLSTLYGTKPLHSVQEYYDSYIQQPKTCLDYMPPLSFIKEHDEMDDYSHQLQPPIHNINNIYKAKFRTTNLLSDGYLLFAFYFSFSVALLMILFRNNRWQHFLVTAVTFILLSIILSIICVILFNHNFGDAYSTMVLLTWLAAAIIGMIYYFKNDKYRNVGIICANLFYITLPFFPFMFSIYLHEVFDLYKCYDWGNNMTAEAILDCQIKQMKWDNLSTWSQILGIGIFVFGIMPFGKLFYAKQKALPREK